MERAKKMKNIDVKTAANTGKQMYALAKELFPICRSITGDGVRETLRIIKKNIDIKINEVPSGTKVFDWTVPKEWNIKDAYIKDPKGNKIADFKRSNLHVLSYSVPVRKKMPFSQLKDHIFTLPEHPDWIPYATSYYAENWGFCLPYKEYKKMNKKGIYEVVIDSSLKKGSLTYGELYLKGRSDEEVLLTCYVCHPSMCNDNLSGVVLLTYLAKKLKHMKLKYSYRFLFIPETIGSITWLSINEKKVPKIKYGLIATCVGDKGSMTYKRSRKGDAGIDKIVEKVLAESGEPYTILDFHPLGSDERQFCSPGFNMPVGSLMRTPYLRYPQYHTSADDLKVISPESLSDSFEKYMKVIYLIENTAVCVSLNPKCEPQLGKRGLCGTIGGRRRDAIAELALLWVLNLSDGTNSLSDISKRSGIKFEKVKEAADILVKHRLLKIE